MRFVNRILHVRSERPDIQERGSPRRSTTFQLADPNQTGHSVGTRPQLFLTGVYPGSPAPLFMLTRDIRSQVDRIWDSFWSGGISNPLEVIEQITFLLFLKRLDDLHTLEERKATRLNKPIARRVFPEGIDARGRPCDDFRWGRFKHFAPADMYVLMVGPCSAPAVHATVPGRFCMVENARRGVKNYTRPSGLRGFGALARS